MDNDVTFKLLGSDVVQHEGDGGRFGSRRARSVGVAEVAEVVDGAAIAHKGGAEDEDGGGGIAQRVTAIVRAGAAVMAAADGGAGDGSAAACVKRAREWRAYRSFMLASAGN